MAVWIKNSSGSSKIYLGQTIANASYYQIQLAELVNWQNDSTLLTDIGNSDAVVAKDDSGSNDLTDVSEGINYLKGVDTTPKDTDGAPLARTKITKSGWHYQCNSLEWTTSTLSSVYSKDKTDSDLGFTSIKFYNSSDTELTTQGDLDTACVRTVVTFEPDEDIEVIGGILFQATAPTNDVRVWVTAIPDLTVAQGGSIPFCQGGLNLKHMGTGEVYSVDGRTPKFMPYNGTYHTNKFELTIRHPAGEKHSLMMVFQLFRENV